MHLPNLYCALFAIMTLTGAGELTAALVVDTSAAIDMVKQSCDEAEAQYRQFAQTIESVGCENIAACGPLLTSLRACRPDPTAGLRSFAESLGMALAAEPGCKGRRVVPISSIEASPAGQDVLSREHWTLTLIYQQGFEKQSWGLVHSMQRDKLFDGEGSAPSIAKASCDIIGRTSN